MRLGLALSGGGFRATLFHLGVVRLLRDAGLLGEITHICSVSGGSILAAHLIQHWQCYSGCDHGFDRAAREVIAFTQYDIRNRILRRLPHRMLPYVPPLRNVLGGRFQLTPTDLLQHYYGRRLYKDCYMADLPNRSPLAPYLHLLTTNLLTAGVCSFTTDGLSFDFTPGKEGHRPSLVRTGLVPVAFAVAASSAFPALFPPLEISCKNLHVKEDDLNTPGLFTDGGVYDNLGARKFEQLVKCKLGSSLLGRDDVPDVGALVKALADRAQADPVKHVLGLLRGEARDGFLSEHFRDDGHHKEALHWLNCLLRRNDFYDPGAWQGVSLGADEEKLRDRAGQLDPQEWVRLHRLLLEAALRDPAKSPDEQLIRQSHGTFDNILISNAGSSFGRVSGIEWGGGPLSLPLSILRTAIRSTDILMYRLSQLDIGSAREWNRSRKPNEPNFIFINIHELIGEATDPTALLPDVQRMLPHIRTDFDRFSDAEVSALVRHGYCAAREAVRQHLKEGAVPEGEPWDPTRPRPLAVVCGLPAPAPRRPLRARLAGALRRWFPRLAAWKRPARKSPVAAPSHHDMLEGAKVLESSSQRRFQFFSLHDWPTYLHLLLLGGLALGLGLLIWQALSAEPLPELWGPQVEPVVMDEKPDEPRYAGFEIVRDDRTLDLRLWGTGAKRPDGAPGNPAVWKRNLYLKRVNPDAKTLRFQWLTDGSAAYPRCTKLPFNVKKYTPKVNIEKKDNLTTWEIEINVSAAPVGEPFDLVVEAITWDGFKPVHEWASMRMLAPAEEVRMWVLFPRHKPFLTYKTYQSKIGSRDQQTTDDGKVSYDRSRRSLYWEIKKPALGFAYILEWDW